MELREIQDLIKFVSRLDLTEVEVAQGDFRLTIRREPPAGIVMQQPMQQFMQPMQMAAPQLPAAPVAAPAAPAAEAVPAPKAESASNLVTFKAPIIGTFYRSSKPGTPSFVEVGDVVSKGKVLCIIEAMKLFNEIECDVAGKIVKILVENGQPVEYDQPLFLIDPQG